MSSRTVKARVPDHCKTAAQHDKNKRLNRMNTILKFILKFLLLTAGEVLEQWHSLLCCHLVLSDYCSDSGFYSGHH